MSWKEPFFVVSNVLCAHLDPGRAEGHRNEKEAFRRDFWTGVYGRTFKGTTDEESSYLRRRGVNSVQELSFPMMESYTNHWIHGSMRSGLDECWGKYMDDDQAWAATPPRAGSLHASTSPTLFLKRKKEPGFCFVLVITDRQTMCWLRAPLMISLAEHISSWNTFHLTVLFFLGICRNDNTNLKYDFFVRRDAYRIIQNVISDNKF